MTLINGSQIEIKVFDEKKQMQKDRKPPIPTTRKHRGEKAQYGYFR